VLRETRHLAPRELDAFHVATELRSPEIRLGVHRGRNVASDYALLARASPFTAPCSRTGLTIVLDGNVRFDEDGRRAWLEPGDLVESDHARQATEAHAGATSCVILLEWSPAFAGAPRTGAFGVGRLDARTRNRLGRLAFAFERDASASMLVEIFDLLRAFGLPFERLTRADVERDAAPSQQQALVDAVARSLSRLEGLPAIDDVQAELALSQRTLHRQLQSIADQYALTWGHWRSALHQARVLSALRMLGAPGATTELVARLAGFRSPSALCHTFAVAGLPSPGVLAREARRDPLTTWADHVASTLP
jgi:AraC-like DNA-binding protein